MNNGPQAVFVHIPSNYSGGIGGVVGNLSGLTPRRGTQIQHAMSRLCLEHSGHELPRLVLKIKPTPRNPALTNPPAERNRAKLTKLTDSLTAAEAGTRDRNRN